MFANLPMNLVFTFDSKSTLRKRFLVRHSFVQREVLLLYCHETICPLDPQGSKNLISSFSSGVSDEVAALKNVQP